MIETIRKFAFVLISVTVMVVSGAVLSGCDDSKRSAPAAPTVIP